MIKGSKMSGIRAWLDDRGKSYKVLPDGRIVVDADWADWAKLFITFHDDGRYEANGVFFDSQRELINEALMKIYRGTYKEL